MEFKWPVLEVYGKICNYLDKYTKSENIIVYISEKETKEIRTLGQNNTFWKIFTEIWNHLWYSKEEIHDIMLWWVFGTYTVELWFIKKEMLNKPKTSKLNKEEWIKFIDEMIWFCKKHNIPIEITPREIQSLYESYNW